MQVVWHERNVENLHGYLITIHKKHKRIYLNIEAESSVLWQRWAETFHVARGEQLFNGFAARHQETLSTLLNHTGHLTQLSQWASTSPTMWWKHLNELSYYLHDSNSTKNIIIIAKTIGTVHGILPLEI